MADFFCLHYAKNAKLMTAIFGIDFAHTYVPIALAQLLQLVGWEKYAYYALDRLLLV